MNGHLGGTCLDKSILKLCATQRSSDSTKLAKEMNAISEEAGLKSRLPYLEGENIFGSVKRKLDLPPGDEFDSHWHDHVNVTIPKLGQTMTLLQCQ